MTNVNVSVRGITLVQKVIIGSLAHAFVRIVSISKSTVDGSLIVSDEIMSVTNNVSRFVANTVLTNVVNTASINSVNKKVR